MFAQMTRQIREEHPFHAGFIITMAARASVKTCGCNRLSCELCGFTKFHQRIRRIASNPKITHGLMVGRPLSPSLL